MNEGPKRDEYQFDLSAGRLCLDFVNTLAGDRAGEPREHLRAYGDVVAFARQAGAITEPHARLLLEEAERRPGDAEAIFRDAIALREALYRMFEAAAGPRAPGAADVAHVSAAFGRALGHRRLEHRDAAFALAWDDPRDALDAPLWRVTESAASLLASGPDRERVRVCGMHDTRECSWVFMDATRAGTRRWCSMTSCGNRAKARRHYKRSKDSGTG